jgi:Xaa-Pro aminopeptidase
MDNPIERLQKYIKYSSLDGFIITDIKNVYYLSKFTGSSGFIFLTQQRAFFFTDFRYKEQAYREVTDFEIIIENGKRISRLDKLIKELGIKKLGFESSAPYEFYEELKKIAPEVVPQYGIVENIRKIKSEEEILKIREAIKRAEDAFLMIKPIIRPNKTEKEIALKMEIALKRLGCKSIPFDIIIASGKNAALPHARPTDKKIEKGDFVIIDWGGEADGYFSDMTRTLLMEGRDLSKKIEIYNIVNNAREKAIESIKIGLNTKKVDKIARDEIRKAGYGNFFGHGTGHGIGVDVHELPSLSRLKGEKILKNMVFTIEPGIYIPELGGVRIEDMVLAGDKGGIVLTSLSRNLEIIK